MSVNRGKTLINLLIPSSLTEESPDPRIRTYKVGQIARAASIFRVDEIVIYKTKGLDDSKFISTVLRYAECPPYLRKKLFPMQDNLRFCGVIPPLRTPHHAVSDLLKNEEEYREGIVTKVGSDQSVWVDVGLDSPVLLKPPHGRQLHTGERISVRIFSRRPITVQLVDKRDIPLYWGYNVRIANTLHEELKDADGLRIATSRFGQMLDQATLSEIKNKTRDKVHFIFGSPSKGVESVLHDEGHNIKDSSDYVVNSIPDQGAATVRTEEAVYITLGLFNLVW
ncbi:hypothetical protein CUJ83_00705 [Methanocella sp. CWC-04]|uniref:RNA-binding protein n=1 Tax=Methanooceanicella nereidis TaxID=2052831 RepID=A0AAP2RCF9_9EURY|nr:RNA methyltransferase [Methanocella sp. CWC-04]MCD1293515.1 hypothetical protein [Methanocella sp. CWC-04]